MLNFFIKHYSLVYFFLITALLGHDTIRYNILQCIIP